jgi:hypothetical protein
MTGRIVAAGILAFGAGWFCGVANHVRRCWPTIVRLSLRLAEAQRDPTHQRCRQVEQRLNDEITFLEDQARDRFDPVAEAEQILDRGERP